MLYTLYNTAVAQYLFGMGAVAGVYQLYIDASGVVNLYTYNVYSSGFTVEAGKTYLFTMQYDGANLNLLINGTLVYKYAVGTLATVASVLYVGRNGLATSGYSYGILHYLEIRTSLRTFVQLGARANSLLLPCFYDKNSATAPTVPSAYSSNYHEYLFADTSTTVADSNTTADSTTTTTTTTDA